MYPYDRSAQHKKTDVLDKRRVYSIIKPRIKAMYNKQEQYLLFNLAKCAPGKFWKKE